MLTRPARARLVMAAWAMVWSALVALLGRPARKPHAAGLVRTAPGIPCGSSTEVRARAGQASPAGGSWSAHSAASDQVARTAAEMPPTGRPDMWPRRSLSCPRYSWQLSRFAFITAAAWARASGRPSRSSPRSSASIR